MHAATREVHLARRRSRRCRSTAARSLKPLTTDLTAAQLIAARLGEVPRVERRTRSTAGSAATVGGGGQSVIIPSEDNRNALAMLLGDSAPQLPTSTFGPGCVKGHPLT